MSKQKPIEVAGDYGIDTVSDCDSLHIAVLSGCEGVRLQFCQPVSFVTMPPEQALIYGQAMLDAAHHVLSQQKAEAEVH